MCSEDTASVLKKEMIEEDGDIYFIKKKKKIVLWFLVLSLVFFGILSVFVWPLWTVFSLFLFPVILYIKNMKKWEKKDYHIAVDKCIGKRKEYYDGDSIYYYICFENHRKHSLYHYASDRTSSPIDYESISIDDVFYLVVLNNHKRPSIIYSAKKWNLDKTGFIEKDGKYYPI